MVARWFFCSVVLIAAFAGSRTEAAYFGNDVFIGNLYGNELITIPRQTARKLGGNMMRRSVMMTNSVLSFLSKCNFEELAHLTNGTHLVSGFYHQFDVDGVSGWALSLSLFKAKPTDCTEACSVCDSSQRNNHQKSLTSSRRSVCN